MGIGVGRRALDPDLEFLLDLGAAGPRAEIENFARRGIDGGFHDKLDGGGDFHLLEFS